MSDWLSDYLQQRQVDAEKAASYSEGYDQGFADSQHRQHDSLGSSTYLPLPPLIPGQPAPWPERQIPPKTSTEKAALTCLTVGIIITALFVILMLCALFTFHL